MSPAVTDYRGCRRAVLLVRESNLKACTLVILKQIILPDWNLILAQPIPCSSTVCTILSHTDRRTIEVKQSYILEESHAFCSICTGSHNISQWCRRVSGRSGGIIWKRVGKAQEPQPEARRAKVGVQFLVGQPTLSPPARGSKGVS